MPKRNTPEDFLARVDKNGPVPTHCPELGPCWVWTGTLERDGYSRVWFGGKPYPAHRLAFIFSNGGIDPDKSACHKCDVRHCCNPDHLFEGTVKENMEDCKQKGRLASGDRHWSRTNPEKLTRGTNHWSVKNPEKHRGDRGGRNVILNPDKVRLMRKMRKDGWKLQALADFFKVSFMCVRHVLAGHTWSYVEDLI